MLFYSSIIKNYQDFDEIFGKIKYSNGRVGRKNKILLSLLKDKNFLHNVAGNQYSSLLKCVSMVELKTYLFAHMHTCDSIQFAAGYPLNIPFIDHILFSTEYKFDYMLGVCADGIPGYVRIVKPDNRIVKVRAGKFFSHIIDNSNYRSFPDTLKTWLCEELCASWKAYTSEISYTLHVSSEPAAFTRIYSSDKSIGDFHSCMTDKGFEDFYTHAVNASAAWLENKEGDMVARCVIFNECISCSGEKYRLAERQYSSGCNNFLNRILINKLIEGNYIDGFKTIGAGCRDNDAFVDINDKPFKNTNFYIHCDIEKSGNTVSFQDSFKYYDHTDKIAYNYETCNTTCTLDTTEGIIDTDELCWSDYEDRYIVSDDAIWVDIISDYVSEYNAVYRERLDDYILSDDSVYCVDQSSYELTEESIKLDSGEYVYNTDSVKTCVICGSTYYDSGYDEDVCCVTCLNELNEKNGKDTSETAV